MGDPLRVYMDLEAGRRRSGREDIFVSYHAKDDVQATYAGALFHNNRNYHVSSWKKNVSPFCVVFFWGGGDFRQSVLLLCLNPLSISVYD